jgi:hypothetical protein
VCHSVVWESNRSTGHAPKGAAASTFNRLSW